MLLKGKYIKRELSSDEIIEFLKEKNLYFKDNGIKKMADGVSSLDCPKENKIVWIKAKSFDIKNLKASIIIVSQNFEDISKDKSIIYTKEPRLAISLIINQFFIKNENKEYISPLSSIDKSAKIGKNVIINEFVTIGENVVIGDNVVIYPNVTIYPNCTIKDNVVINTGAKIGQEGFGYIKDENGKYINFPHIGKVIIEKNVEIGSNVAIDRGALSDTLIGENTKINNLVHIAHNVKIGSNCLIGAKVEISGSVKIEDEVYIGPNATIIDGTKIAKGATIGLGAIVRSDVKAKETIVPLESTDKRTYIKRLKILRGK